MNELFTDLLCTHSISGVAEPAAEVVKKHCSKWADKVSQDVIGNVYVEVNPADEGGILMAAHMDEIGLIVNMITDEGFLHVYPAGGIKVCLYFGHQVRVITRKGVIYGSVCVGDVYSKDAKATDIVIDIGCSTKAEAEELVEVGDPITLDSDYHELSHNRICSRALDDKSGVYVITEALRRAKERGLKTRATVATTIGEETSMNGGHFAAGHVKPKFAIVVDTTYAADHPHCSPKEDYGDTALGKGPVVSMNPIIKRAHIQAVKDIAREHNIPLQFEVSGYYSCTDADRIHYSGAGIPVMILSIPIRNMHTPAETLDLGDTEHLIELIANILLSYNPEA